MLVNHLNSFHPGVSLDTIPELNVPILKAYCNFYCLYCDKVSIAGVYQFLKIFITYDGIQKLQNV